MYERAWTIFPTPFEVSMYRIPICSTAINTSNSYSTIVRDTIIAASVRLVLKNLATRNWSSWKNILALLKMASSVINTRRVGSTETKNTPIMQTWKKSKLDPSEQSPEF